MEYEVYRHKQATDEEFEHIDSFFKRVLAEDKDLCNATQENLNAGYLVNGQLHPDLESAPLYFQSLVRGLLKQHRAKEQEVGREVWPARQETVGAITKEDMEFCSGLGCESNVGLDW